MTPRRPADHRTRCAHRRTLVACAAAAALAVALGCGDNPTGNGGGGGGPPPPGPFGTTEIYLRPLSVALPPQGNGRPTPSLAVYNLTCFFEGGATAPTFDWTVPAAIGTVVPKTPQLGIHDATVHVQVRPDGQPPLGLFEISAAGHSGSENSNISARFAVVRNTWMKHQRRGWVEPEPPNPVSWPLFRPEDGTIIYTVHQNSQDIRLKRIPAFSPLGGAEAAVDDVVLLPTLPEGNNFGVAEQSASDLSPFTPREILLSTRMDMQYPQRCPTGPAGCTSPAPLNLWVGAAPEGIRIETPRQLTFDSTFVDISRIRWYAFDYDLPRWSPTAIDGEALIAFISTNNPNRDRDIWTAVLRDTTPPGAMPPDPTSDAVFDYRALTSGGGIVAFAWHPDGSRLCVARASGLQWVDIVTGAPTPIQMPPNSLERFLSPSVYVGPGQPTPLIAFQAEVENQANIYLLDEAAQTLTKLLPFPVPVTHDLFPRWHPTRKAIVYSGDYTVETWAQTTPPGNRPIPDQLNPNGPEFEGMRRTRYPSPWVVELE
jgi:hypothetical protein